MDLDTMAICPDCKQGKHANCDSGAWDEKNDRPTPCRCWVQAHNLDEHP